jgi:hypothetical protein
MSLSRSMPLEGRGGSLLGMAGAIFSALLFLVPAGRAAAQEIAPVGCPVFHCTAEATGVMAQPVVPRVSRVTNNAALGTLKGQGCSGDGVRLACLFATDTVVGSGQGTLKVLDATTLQPLWGSRDAPNSFELDAASASMGQAPLMFADGQIAAGDASWLIRYDAAGGATGVLPLAGKGNNLGLTPVSDNFGIVSQTDGMLTLVNMATWQSIATLQLRDPVTQTPVALVSPSSATTKVLYAVGGIGKTNTGYLFAVVYDSATKRLKVRSTYVFTGKSGASPVVVPPAVSGLASNVVLLHVPGLVGDTTPHDRLLALTDTGAGFTKLWSIDLAQPLLVTPTIDQASKTLFFVYGSDRYVHQHDLLSGSPLASYDIRLLGGFPVNFTLNGHLGAAPVGGAYTLLLAGAVTATPGVNGQYVIAFDPSSTTPSVVWTAKVRSRADQYTGAWNLAPSGTASTYCPVVVGSSSGISRICDF